ncbi:hypothetical protein [Effusibacillus consociatus]|uniref:Uncharacterized protein n=1 Tax=Effusibacillus consociatus TaxID=1117041 RepID=A0ABV9Q7M3_9BACL
MLGDASLAAMRSVVRLTAEMPFFFVAVNVMMVAMSLIQHRRIWRRLLIPR